MASQSTAHPTDNQVFSIRKVMLMMSVPNSFQWSDISFEKLNAMTTKEKPAFLKKEEMNIRQNLGEAVPTIIFRQIAHKVRKVLSQREYTEQEITALIQKKIVENGNLLKFIREDKIRNFATLSKIAELANAQRYNNAAYYTRIIDFGEKGFKGVKIETIAATLLLTAGVIGSRIVSRVNCNDFAQNLYDDHNFVNGGQQNVTAIRATISEEYLADFERRLSL